MKKFFSFIFIVAIIATFVIFSFSGNESLKEMIYQSLMQAMTCIAFLAFIKNSFSGSVLEVKMTRKGKVVATYKRRGMAKSSSPTGAALALAGEKGLAAGEKWAVKGDRDISVRRESCELTNQFFDLFSFADVTVVEIKLHS